MKRMAMVGVLLLAGCESANPPPQPLYPNAHAEPGATDIDKERAAIYADLRTRMRLDPARTMIELGIPLVEFEGMAKALFVKWRDKFPSTPASGSKPAVPVQPVADANWWCTTVVEDPESAGNVCYRSKPECDEYRAKPGRSGETFTPCFGQGVVACFTLKSLLYNASRASCTPSISSCRRYRDFILANKSADYTVEGECIRKE